MKTPGISETKRVMVTLKINTYGDIVPIITKLPQDAEIVTGVFFSINKRSLHTGIISLRFSEGISNSVLNQRVTNKHFKRKKVKYLPLYEPVTDACNLQGFYTDTSAGSIYAPTGEANYELLIYIEYIPRKADNTTSHEREFCS